MKFNFWQIIGVLLLLLGVAGIVYREYGPAPKPDAPVAPPAATAPATAPMIQ